MNTREFKYSSLLLGMKSMLNRRSFILGAATGVGAMTVMSSKIVKAAAEQTMSLNVIYPNHDGARFDMRYYRDTHIPLAMKVMKADGVMLIEGVPMGASAAPCTYSVWPSAASHSCCCDDHSSLTARSPAVCANVSTARIPAPRTHRSRRWPTARAAGPSPISRSPPAPGTGHNRECGRPWPRLPQCP